MGETIERQKLQLDGCRVCKPDAPLASNGVRIGTGSRLVLEYFRKELSGDEGTCRTGTGGRDHRSNHENRIEDVGPCQRLGDGFVISPRRVIA